MKKATLSAVVAYLTETGYSDTAVMGELNAELHRGEAAKAERKSAYDEAKAAVLEVLAMTTAPLTAAEIYDECADKLPEGFTKGKVSYGLTRLWGDAIVKVEGVKGVNCYRRA